MKTTPRLDRKIQLAFGCAIAALLALGAVSQHSITVSSESDRWVRHTHEVVENLEGLLSSMEKIESSCRGFVLTGQESYFESYRASIAMVKQDAEGIRNLTVDNPVQQAQLPVLQNLVGEQIQFGERLIGLRRVQGVAAAADAIRRGPGQRISDKFQSVVRQMEAEEQRLLILRSADAKRRLGQTRTAVIFGTFLGLVIAVAAGWRLQQDSSRSGQTENALRDSEEKYALLLNRDLGKSKESGAKYRGLLEAAPDAMVVVNQAGEIVLLNVRAEKQFGYSRDELVGQKVKNIIPEGFAERLIADALRTTEDALAQQIGTGIELTGRHKNGGEFPIEIMLSPLESAEGILVTAAIRDITTRKTAEAQLLAKVAELNRSNEELGQFAYIASHDLQEPLRMVASYTQLLSRRYKGKLDADADEFIAFAVDGASRMQRLIQDLLAYSRVGTKGKDLLDTSSEDALRQALVNLRGAIQEKGALVTHDPLPSVMADEMQLIQLFQNLVGNAIKYQNPGIPKVQVSVVRDDGEKWMFSVKDNGLGIAPQYFERIFGMFQRLHKREEFDGTGIGLSICKKIVERHGGTISVESQPGQGATFRFALTGSGKTMKAKGGQ